MKKTLSTVKQKHNLKNIYKNIPDTLPSEFTEIILSSEKIRVEIIVSRGHSSSDGFWYDQEENEFVVLLKGKARLAFEDGKEITLKPGDYINIPAHLKHRVEWTLPKKDTVWLAVFFEGYCQPVLSYKLGKDLFGRYGSKEGNLSRDYKKIIREKFSRKTKNLRE